MCKNPLRKAAGEGVQSLLWNLQLLLEGEPDRESMNIALCEKARICQAQFILNPFFKEDFFPWMERIVEFSDWSGLEIRLVYYPPYHSKYNRIERCWSALERHWNGTQLHAHNTW